jgi:hypothetical protein
MNFEVVENFSFDIQCLKCAFFLLENSEPETIGLGGFGQIPFVGRGGGAAGRYAPGSVSEINNSLFRIYLAIFNFMRSFEGVIVVLESDLKMVFFKQRDPIFADFDRSALIEGIR